MFKYTHLFLHFILLRSEKSCKFVNELEIFPKDVIFPFYLSFTIPNTSCINKSPLYRHRERGSGSINFLRRQEDLKGKKRYQRHEINALCDRTKKKKEKNGRRNDCTQVLERRVLSLDKWLIPDPFIRYEEAIRIIGKGYLQTS